MTTPMNIDFMDWVIVDFNGWKLKENAPQEVIDKFNQFMKDISMIID